MFRRKYLFFGNLVSDEGFEISFAHKSAYYSDSRGKFEFGYEPGYLSETPYQIEGERVLLTKPEIDEMVGRVVRAHEFNGDRVDVFRK